MCSTFEVKACSVAWLATTRPITPPTSLATAVSCDSAVTSLLPAAALSLSAFSLTWISTEVVNRLSSHTAKRSAVTPHEQCQASSWHTFASSLSICACSLLFRSCWAFAEASRAAFACNDSSSFAFLQRYQASQDRLKAKALTAHDDGQQRAPSHHACCSDDPAAGCAGSGELPVGLRAGIALVIPAVQLAVSAEVLVLAAFMRQLILLLLLTDSERYTAKT